MIKAHIGIDPGKSGGITIILTETINNEVKITTHVMPTIGSEIDIRTLNNILKEFKIQSIQSYCCLESVHAIYGASAGATFDFGYGVGVIEGILTASEIPYSKIQPKKWQAKMFEGIPLQTKLSSTGKTTQNDTKKMALMAAQRIFPTMDFLQTPRCKKPHDGLIDATLIAEYCRRTFN